MAHIGIVITASPVQYENWETALAIGGSALDKGHRVSFFFSMDGILNVIRTSDPDRRTDGPGERFQALGARGARLCACGTAAEARGRRPSDFIPGVIVGGLPDLALLISELDRLVTL